jgi:hypothetical protein
MQLTGDCTRALLRVLWPALWAASLPGAVAVRAEDGVQATTTVFYESGNGLHTTVVNPAASANVDLGNTLSLNAGWQADIVTGASVAVVDAPSGEVDAITTATVYDDIRHSFRGGLQLAGDDAQIRAAYTHGFESDYRSHTLNVSAGAQLFDRNTTFEITYAKNWDSVCDLAQPNAEKAVERQRLPSSDGCFGKRADRTQHGLDLHSLQGAFTQAWTPIFNTQLAFSTQLIDGFQANPYRAVWLGRSQAQEHHPEHRIRYALALSARIWLRPVGGALQMNARAYRDTWDIQALSGELAYERNLGDLVRLRLRGRYYTQTRAAFYSDDYALAPRGRYFTGDRELSTMQSALGGARFEFMPAASDDGRVVGFLETLLIVLKADYLRYFFDDFRYGRLVVPNDQALFGTLGVEATF